MGKAIEHYGWLVILAVLGCVPSCWDFLASEESGLVTPEDAFDWLENQR